MRGQKISSSCEHMVHFDLGRTSFHTKQLRQGIPSHDSLPPGPLHPLQLRQHLLPALSSFCLPRLHPLPFLAPSNAAHAVVQWMGLWLGWMLPPNLIPCPGLGSLPDDPRPWAPEGLFILHHLGSQAGPVTPLRIPGTDPARPRILFVCPYILCLVCPYIFHPSPWQSLPNDHLHAGDPLFWACQQLLDIFFWVPGGSSSVICRKLTFSFPVLIFPSITSPVQVSVFSTQPLLPRMCPLSLSQPHSVYGCSLLIPLGSAECCLHR